MVSVTEREEYFYMKKTASKYYIFRGEEILVMNENTIPAPEKPEELGLLTIRSFESAQLSESSISWAEVDRDAEAPSGMKFISRRHLLDILGEEAFAPAGLAYHYMNWTRNTLYCGRCGGIMRDSDIERARVCSNCGYISYPLICPAIIVAVEREGMILLARSPRFPKGRYSVLAGFVEPGESLEDTVRREVMEEVSIELDEVRYFGSQPWPFPHSLMLGFTASWKSGEINIDGVEIEDAHWYSPENIPNIPSTRSISGRLIKNFLAKN